MEFALADATDLLSRTPSVLEAELAGLPDAWLQSDEGPDTFSPFAVVGHLIDGERSNWLPRLRQILSSGSDTPLPAFDRFAHRQRDTGRSIDDLLTEFADLRRDNLSELEGLGLGPQQLSLVGSHPSFGQTTVAELLAAWVVHDLGHLAQVARVLAKQYGAAIGPWRTFLPVVSDRPVPVT